MRFLKMAVFVIFCAIFCILGAESIAESAPKNAPKTATKNASKTAQDSKKTATKTASKPAQDSKKTAQKTATKDPFITPNCSNLKKFTAEQKKILLYAFKFGLKSGFGYTMAAIAWKESCAGALRTNFADPSAGIYHAFIPGVLKRHNKRVTSFNINIAGEKLATDAEFASQTALDELLYWQRVRNGAWEEVVKSYNKGFKWESGALADTGADLGANSLESRSAKTALKTDKKAAESAAEEYVADIKKKVLALQTYFGALVPNLAKTASRNDYALKAIRAQNRTKSR